jgi:hypothetical protein
VLHAGFLLCLFFDSSKTLVDFQWTTVSYPRTHATNLVSYTSHVYLSYWVFFPRIILWIELRKFWFLSGIMCALNLVFIHLLIYEPTHWITRTATLTFIHWYRTYIRLFKQLPPDGTKLNYHCLACPLPTVKPSSLHLPQRGHDQFWIAVSRYHQEYITILFRQAVIMGKYRETTPFLQHWCKVADGVQDGYKTWAERVWGFV